ncbi:hypothetical protein B0H19DRAFT_1266650 [Mycena capillaripes]|nr:hypothetical protein B0H19DRAFT_1266650 [Mycena capillaripes]
MDPDAIGTTFSLKFSHPLFFLNAKKHTGIDDTPNMVLSLSTLTYLSVHECYPHQLIAQLHKIQPPANIMSLHVCFYSVPDADINKIFSDDLKIPHFLAIFWNVAYQWQDGSLPSLSDFKR